MSDSRLRELERRWKETQSVGDEAAYLLERVRTGDLARERLELASHLGDPASLQALDRPGPQDLGEWALGFGRFGREVCVRAGLVALRWRIGVSNRAPELTERALSQVEQWLSEPTPHQERGVLEAGHAIRSAFLGTVLDGLGDQDAEHALAAAARALCGAVCAPSDLEAAQQLLSSVELLVLGQGPDHLRAAVRDALVPWALVEPAATRRRRT